MSKNPYESPESLEGPEAFSPFAVNLPHEGRRPWGVFLLGLAHIGSGLLLGCAIILLFAVGQAPSLGSLGLPIFVVGLTIAIGIGLLRGENWGWRGSAFMNVVQVLQPILSLVHGTPSMQSVMEAVVCAGLFAYLFSDRALNFFGMYGIPKLPTAGRIVGICCVLLAIITFLN